MRKLAVASLLFGIAAVARASAQGSSAITYNPSVYAGLAFPIGNISTGVNAGYTVGAAVDVGMRMPVSLRAEASYTKFDAVEPDVSGRINAVLGVPMAVTGLLPYVIGGIGIYRATGNFLDADVGDRITATRFGWNIGAGIDMPMGRVAGQWDVRYHHVSLDNGISYTYVPITFGIRF
jgi:opacity protein-like surface antigen